MPRKDPYYVARIRGSIRDALEKRRMEEHPLGSLNLFIEEILLKYVSQKTKKRPSVGS